MTSDLLTVSQAADYLNMPVGSLNYWRTIGSGPAYVRPSPRRVLYLRADLDAFIQQSKTKVAS